MSKSTFMSPNQLVHLLRSQIIPWTAPGARSGIFVAREKMRSLVVPEGVAISRQKRVGQRKIVKGNRNYGNRRYFVADWPEDNLQELAVPKLACVVEGVADYLLGDYCAHCNTGTFFLIPPLVPHHRQAPNLLGDRRRNGSCAILHAIAHQHGVHFWYSRSINDRYTNESTDNYLIPSESAAQILHLLVDESAAERSHFKSVATNLIAAFYAVVAREIEAGNYMHTGAIENISAPKHDENFSDQVRGYLEANCNRRLRLDGVAAHMYMSRAQFSRRMQQEMGKTFGELLTDIRMEHACKLLHDTDFTIAVIAGWVSFRSSTHFQALFRARMGCTPTEYRQKTSSKK
jgi:AraC-like DNA-binding protein